MNADEAAIIIAELEKVVQAEISKAASTAVRAALTKHFGIRGKRKSSKPTRLEFGEADKVLVPALGSCVLASAMVRECRRCGLPKETRFLESLGYTPARVYIDGIRTRVWTLPPE